MAVLLYSSRVDVSLCIMGVKLTIQNWKSHMQNTNSNEFCDMRGAVEVLAVELSYLLQELMQNTKKCAVLGE